MSIGEMGDYDRWKCDPDWGQHDKSCLYCNGTGYECDRYECARCRAKGCSNTLIAEEGDEWECEACNRRCDAEERAEGGR